MTFKDDNLRFVVLKALADAVAEELAEMRTEHLGALLERYDEEGSLKFSVRLPSTGALIGALTLPEPKDKYEVTDEAAFTAWFAENHPDAVTVEVIPGEPERTVKLPATPEQKITTIDPKHRTAIIKALKSTDDGIVDTVTGSFVKGVTFTKGKRPDRFAVTYEDEGREQLAAAYRAGELDSIVTGTALPPVNGRVVIERHLAPTEVSPARAALDEYVDELADKYEPGGVYNPLAADNADELGPEYSDGYALPGESTEVRQSDDPWVDVPVIGEQAADFDPGSWGASPSTTGTGW